MIFQIIDMDKMHRNFIVSDASGNKMKVNGYQIVSVLANGSSCTNARLIEGGFELNTGNELIKIHPQLDNMTRRKISTILKQLGNNIKNEEHNTTLYKASNIRESEPSNLKTSEPSNIKKYTAKAKASASMPNERHKKQIPKKENIFHRGTLYYGIEDLCNRNGCKDLERFKKLYDDGYSIEICLGKEEIDKNAPAPIPRRKIKESIKLSETESLWNSTDNKSKVGDNYGNNSEIYK